MRRGLSIITVFVCIFLFALWRYRPLTVDGRVRIEKGDTVRSFFSLLDMREEYRLRLYLRQHPESMKKLQEGSYTFSGSYSPTSFIEQINQGPKQFLEKITILEGWSIYDIDAMLTKKGFISTGQYISRVRNFGMGFLSDDDGDPISPQNDIRSFLFNIFDDDHDNSIHDIVLEGFLYPDTYLINPDTDVLHQIVQLQLKAFNKKVRDMYSSEMLSFGDRLRQNGYSFTLSPYQIITLASIIEKEEKSLSNKPIIAGLFLNRIERGMRIDADITLCYGRALPYETCTPSVIVASINDASNPYNTRVQSGLTPTPIGNPSVETIRAVLEFQKTNNLYYLHDAQGQIYFAEDIQGHNSNKSTYL